MNKPLEEEFPFNNQYYELIKGKTLSKRGVWWTALLLVETKAKTDAIDNTGDDSEKEKKKQKIQKKVIIQRWRRFKQGEDGFRWSKSKDFTISSKKQWAAMKEILDEWENEWD